MASISATSPTTQKELVGSGSVATWARWDKPWKEPGMAGRKLGCLPLLLLSYPQSFAALLCRASQTLSVLLPASQSTGGTVKDGTCFPRPRWDVLLSIMAMLGLLDPGGLKQGLKRGEKKGKCLYFFLTNCQGIFGTFHPLSMRMQKVEQECYPSRAGAGRELGWQQCPPCGCEVAWQQWKGD